MFVCLCKAVTDTQIRQAVSEGASSLREVHALLGTASQCGKCGMMTRDIVNAELANQATAQQANFYSAA